MKALKFEIWGEFAHFRKPYTTTSPLTFPFPTRPAIAGMIGAIIGIEKNNDICQNNDSSIAICLKNPVKKSRIGINLTQAAAIGSVKAGFVDLQQTKNKLNQIRYEYLKDPAYIVYFSHKDEKIYRQLKQHLQNHTSVFTPYLGISEHIANFKFVDETELTEVEAGSPVYINSVIPKKQLKENLNNFEENSEYFNVRMPNQLNNERIVQEYIEAVFEKNGKPIEALPNRYWKDEETNIVFL